MESKGQRLTDIQKVNTTSQICRNCGGTYPHEQQCPAQGKTCHKCGKANHFAKVCRGGATKPHNRTRNERQRKPQMKTKPARKNPVHPVFKASDSASSDEEYLYTVKNKQPPKVNVKVGQNWFKAN